MMTMRERARLFGFLFCAGLFMNGLFLGIGLTDPEVVGTALGWNFFWMLAMLAVLCGEPTVP